MKWTEHKSLKDSANFMGDDSELMESFLKASAKTKRTDTGVTKI